jgi:hypothetical protein
MVRISFCIAAIIVLGAALFGQSPAILKAPAPSELSLEPPLGCFWNNEDPQDKRPFVVISGKNLTPGSKIRMRITRAVGQEYPEREDHYSSVQADGTLYSRVYIDNCNEPRKNLEVTVLHKNQIGGDQ